MENSRDKQFIGLILGTMRWNLNHLNLLHSGQDLIHPFLRHIHTVYAIYHLVWEKTQCI